jgi:long-subunit fatty acid transport protein
MKKLFITILSLCLLINNASAQTDNLGSWNIINLQYAIENKWSVFGEAQLRSLKFYNNFHYYEYKGGVNYKVNKNLRLTLGTGSYQTYKEGGDFVLPKNNDEFRLWPQVILFQTVGRFKIEQRYRAEFRFTSNGYRNRFRYRFGLSYPFGKVINDYKPFQISVSNELFFTNNEPYFERNRLMFGFNYKPSKTSTLQIGYLHQFDYKINDETGRSFLVVGFYYELFRKSTSKAESGNELKDN